MSVPPTPQPDPARPMSRRSIGIAAFSTVVEWYDFTLYLYFVTVLSRVFFGGGAQSLTETLGGFAVAYLMRPVGAIVFGHLGDRIGRRPAMLYSMGLMMVAMLATALLPTYESVGPVAGVALIVLRCLMSFSVGGEYTGVVAYLLEGARPHRRGLIASIASAASEVGALLAAGVAAATVWLVPAPALDSWGWRIPFLVGAVLAGSILVARLHIEESPDFERQRAEGSIPEAPIRHVLARHRAGIARGFAISALGSITYYVGITYVPAFLEAVSAAPPAEALSVSTIAAVAVIAVTPFVGLLSDRIGRRPVLIGLALAAIVLPTALFAAMASGTGVLAGALILAALGGGVSAVGAVTTAEQFPGEGRLSGLALGATTATAVFGGLTPLVAHLLVTRLDWPGAPGAMIAAVALVVVLVFLRMPETAPARIAARG